VPNENEREFISIIYNKKNDSPKYIELKKSRLLLFIIGLPTITLIALVLGVIGLVHTSPFRLIDTYKQDSIARDAISKTNSLMNKLQKSEDENISLTKKISEMDEEIKKRAIYRKQQCQC
jgi:predicted lipid-binding transport protein (Tim44 family)